MIQCNIRDISKHRLVEAALLMSENQYHSLFENMLDGYAYCKMIFDNTQPQDFIYLDANTAFGELTGLKDVIAVGDYNFRPYEEQYHLTTGVLYSM